MPKDTATETEIETFRGPEEPNLLRHLFPAYRVPRCSFAEDQIPLQVPPIVSCIDATFGQGISSGLRQPTPQQGVQLGELLDRLNAKSGLLRRIELRVEASWGIEMLRVLLERYHDDNGRIEPVASLHPSPSAVKPVTGLGLREAGLVLGVSDYQFHIAHLTPPDEAIDNMLLAVEACLEHQIQPRLDLVDVTRADVEGVLLPLLERCQERLAQLGGGQLKVRLCDSLGVGLPWAEAPVPRSVPRLIRVLAHAVGLQPHHLEFVGANDLGLALANTLSAAINGCGGLVGSISGAGERSGIAPLELLLVQLSGLYGLDCDLTVVTEIIDALVPLGLELPARHPLWGERGLSVSHLCSLRPLEETQELYAPFSTRRLLARPPWLRIMPSTGALGVAYLIRRHMPDSEVQPGDEGVQRIYAAVVEQGLDPLTWEAIEPLVRKEGL
jgi:isopropylmalate/homocitrate/citramalate synthase